MSAKLIRWLSGLLKMGDPDFNFQGSMSNYILFYSLAIITRNIQVKLDTFMSAIHFDILLKHIANI